ncbi:MAG TPA: chemotaxis protein CheA [Gemmatimonadales bacterium]|nr:chemotaxis protein CheA [Gemmatimonadales bacterium]
MDLSRYATLFVTESREHLGACSQLLLDWERDPRATEPVVGIFRAMHTFKGMAAAMGYANLTELAHRTESLLDVLRSDPGSASPELHDLLFSIVDALEAGVNDAVAGNDGALDFTGLLAGLDNASVVAQPTGSWAIPARAPEPVVGTTGRVVRVAIRPGAPMRGARALIALRKAETLGTVASVRPAPAAFEQDEFDGKFAFRLETSKSDEEVRQALLTAGDVVSVDVGDVAAPVTAAVSDEKAAGEGGGRNRQIRVDLRRLDALMNQVGELVVAKGRLAELVSREGNPELEAVSARVARVVAEMQAEVIQARMTPVWQVFDRFPRVVRDLSRQLGKRVAFEVEGEEIELDRALLDELGEPLIHMLRNAVDHGIESPAERKKRNKPAEARVRLSATRERSGVAIRVSDDGAGIDRKKVLAKALKQGLAEPGTTELTDDQLLRVLMRPGFSTATQVTDVSGRGMGMDAVVSRVRALGGSVHLGTVAGEGSTFTLHLPTTLAILRALLARVGEERYAVPLTSVAETLEFDGARAAEVQGRETLLLRDQVIPTVHLRERLGVGPRRTEGRRPTIVLDVGGRRSALVVDGLVGQQEIVVEAFDGPRGMLPVFSGATILGDGVPVLILDPAALV